MENIVEHIKNRHPDLLNAQIEGVLYLINTSKCSSVSELVAETGLPKAILVDLVKTIGTFLQTDTDKLLFKTEFKLDTQPYKWALFEYNTEEFESKLSSLREKYFFSSKRELDQFFATSHTSVSKALAIMEKTGLKGTKIALLGDDDLLSFAIPLLSQNYSEIVIFDIDTELLTKVEAAVIEQGFKNIKTVQYDVRNELPIKYQNYFDVVFTDPPYTKAGFDLFLDRSVQLAKIPSNYGGSYIFICYGIGLKNTEREAKLLDSINVRNLYLEDKLFKFNRYIGADTVGNASSLYILKTTPFTSVIQKPLTESIYTFENVKEEKFPYVDHYVFKLHGVDKGVMNSKAKITAAAGEFCSKHKLKVMNTHTTHFKPHGLSLTYILANSNLIIHTWEEYDAIHIDLITCSPVFNAVNLSNTLRQLFKPRNVEYYKVA